MVFFFPTYRCHYFLYYFIWFTTLNFVWSNSYILICAWKTLLFEAESIGQDIMQSIQSYLRSGASTKQINFGRGGVIIPTTTTHTIINFNNSLCKPKSKQQSKLLAAKKHREAEKRRRLRINGQYATLQTILPNLIKVCTVPPNLNMLYSQSVC